MPLLQPPPHKPKLPLKSGHVQTIFPRLFRKVNLPPVVKRRIETPDGDFLDIDWHLAGSSRLAVIAHGMEGNSRRPYVLGMARALVLAGWDCITYNFRGCSSEMNKKPCMYHSGDTRDLHTVLEYGLNHGIYDDAALVGFSMGGNHVLKYLGEDPDKVPAKVKKAIAISVPCDLEASAATLCKKSNYIYSQYFFAIIEAKIKLKNKQYPDLYPLDILPSIKNIIDFDNAYTAPVNGFADASEYYRKSSCKQFLKNIRVPSLILNAKDDPFLPPECYPIEEAENSPIISLLMPRYGGMSGLQPCPCKNSFGPKTRQSDF